MKNLAVFWAIIISASLSAQNNQSIIKVQEIDPGGGFHDSSERKVADINSEIQINIDKNRLKKEMVEQMSTEDRTTVDSLIDQLKELQEMLANGVQPLKDYEAGMRLWARQNEEEREIDSLLSVLRPVAEIGQQITQFAYKTPAFRSELQSTLRSKRGAPVYERYQAMYAAAEKYSFGLQKKLEYFLEKDSVAIRLGAWIYSQAPPPRPIHLPGFDHLREEERYEVQRINISLSPEQEKTIHNMAITSDSVNRFGIQPTMESLIKNIKPSVYTILNKAQGCTNEIIEQTQFLNSSLSQHNLSLSPGSNSLIQKIIAYSSHLDSLISKYASDGLQSSSEANLLTESNQDLTSFVRFFTTVKQLRDSLSKMNSNSPEVFRQITQHYIGAFLRCEGGLSPFVTAAGSTSGILESIFGIKKINDKIFSFSKEVIKHDLESLPSETRFSLLHAGPRQDGDILVIRLGMSTENEPRGRTLERHDLRLYRQFYIETKTSMAFVDHLDQTQEERKQFQLAPSYSVLFKWGNRKKVAFNQFWKPGIGLNIASPDLQLDEAPDIALSLTGSIINDWIQAGGGYNVTGEAPYWFFALRLPIISLAPNSLDTGQMPMPDN